MKATAVLLSHDRVGNLDAIVGRMRECQDIDEIIVWHNGKDGAPLDRSRGWMSMVDHVVESTENYFTYGRFVGALKANNDLIVTCDDDWLVDDWDRIIEDFVRTFDGRTSITARLAPNHLLLDKTMRFEGMHEVLLGWGSAFLRSWVSPALMRWIDVYGVDALLYRKADRVFSMLLETEHRVSPAEGRELQGAIGPNALYFRKDHMKLTDDARRCCVEIVRSAREVDDAEVQ